MRGQAPAVPSARTSMPPGAAASGLGRDTRDLPPCYSAAYSAAPQPHRRVGADAALPPPDDRRAHWPAALRQRSRRTGSRATNFLGRSWAGSRVIPARSRSRRRPSPLRHPFLLPSLGQGPRRSARRRPRPMEPVRPCAGTAPVWSRRVDHSDSSILAGRALDLRSLLQSGGGMRRLGRGGGRGPIPNFGDACALAGIPAANVAAACLGSSERPGGPGSGAWHAGRRLEVRPLSDPPPFSGPVGAGPYSPPAS